LKGLEHCQKVCFISVCVVVFPVNGRLTRFTLHATPTFDTSTRVRHNTGSTILATRITHSLKYIQEENLDINFNGKIVENFGVGTNFIYTVI